MVISSDAVLERVKVPINREQLQIAALHEDRVKFCVKKCLEYNRPQYTAVHLDYIAKLLPIPKYNKYVSELSFPLPIMETADVIFSNLYKIFDAQNKAVYPTLANADLTEEFIDYLDSIDFNEFWQTTAWQAFRNQPNCLIVVDMPTVQVTPRPAPCVYCVDITAVKDMDIDKNGVVLSVMFVNADKQLVAIDEEKYLIFQPITGKKDDWETVPSESYHYLGYCPATFLVKDALDAKHLIIKESPVTKVLWGMERLLIRTLGVENLDAYASYPIHVISKTECEYQDEYGNRCVGGYINFQSAMAIASSAHGGVPGPLMLQKPCPVCNENHLVGPGSAYEGQPDANGKFDLDQVVRIVGPDVDGLNYVTDKVEKIKDTLVQSCSGQIQTSSEAMNQTQVTSLFEDRQTILLRTKRHFERAIKFVMDAFGQLMFEGAYTGSTVNLGTRFMLQTVEQVQIRLDGAVKSNAPQYDIGLIRDEMSVTEYANNPYMLKRIKILERLEPYPNLATADTISLLGTNKITPINFELKYNFINFIARFEDENGDIVEFGSLLTFSKKINTIKLTLESYAKENISGLAADSTGQPGNGQTLPLAS